MSLQLREGAGRKLCLISVARISLGFGKRLMPENGHDLVRGASGFGEPTACRLPQPVRLAVEWKSGSGDCVAHPLAESIDGVGPAVFGVDDREVFALALGDREHLPQRLVERYYELALRLLLHDADRRIRDICPCHAMHVRAPLSGIEHQREGEPLLCADRPPVLERRNLDVRPRSDFLGLGTIDAERRIMREPPDVDRMPDQDAEHFQDRERGARPVGIGLEDPGDDPLARQTRDGALAVLRSQH